MQKQLVQIGLALGLAAAGLRADVTIRYQTEFKPAAALQPMMEPLLKAMQNGPGASMSIRVKGTQGYTTAGSLTQIFDLAKGDVTLVDPAHKTYATFPLSELMDRTMAVMPAMPELPDAAKQVLAGMKSHIESKATGKTDEIQGVRAEEREVIFTLDIPVPAGAVQQAGAGISMKLVMHIWTAKKEETLRVAAIRELAGYQIWQRYIMNPAGMLKQLGGKLPGLSEMIGPLVEEISNSSAVILRTRTEVYIPFLALAAKQAAAQGQSVPAIDPDAPLIEVNREVAELSNAPVDASLFEIPRDYTAGQAADILRELIKAQSGSLPTK